MVRVLGLDFVEVLEGLAARLDDGGEDAGLFGLADVVVGVADVDRPAGQGAELPHQGRDTDGAGVARGGRVEHGGADRVPILEGQRGQDALDGFPPQTAQDGQADAPALQVVQGFLDPRKGRDLGEDFIRKERPETLVRVVRAVLVSLGQIGVDVLPDARAEDIVDGVCVPVGNPQLLGGPAHGGHDRLVGLHQRPAQVRNDQIDLSVTAHHVPYRAFAIRSH